MVAFGINSTLVKGRWCQQTVEAPRGTMTSIIIHYNTVHPLVIVEVACIIPSYLSLAKIITVFWTDILLCWFSSLLLLELSR